MSNIAVYYEFGVISRSDWYGRFGSVESGLSLQPVSHDQFQVIRARDPLPVRAHTLERGRGLTRRERDAGTKRSGCRLGDPPQLPMCGVPCAVRLLGNRANGSLT